MSKPSSSLIVRSLIPTTISGIRPDAAICSMTSSPTSIPATASRRPSSSSAMQCTVPTLHLWCFHTQLQEAIDVCRAFPDLPIVINHIGGPLGIGPFAGKREEVFAVWLKHIRELAKMSNVFLKVGGMGMRFTGYDFH